MNTSKPRQLLRQLLCLLTAALFCSGLLLANTINTSTTVTNQLTTDNAYFPITDYGPSSSVTGADVVGVSPVNPYTIGYVIVGTVPEGTLQSATVTVDIANGVAIQIWNPATETGGWVVESGLGDGVQTYDIPFALLPSAGQLFDVIGYGGESSAAMSATLVATVPSATAPEPGTIVLLLSGALMLVVAWRVSKMREFGKARK